MKKLIILLSAIGVIGFLGWYAYDLNNNSGKSDTELIEFAVNDISTVDKVIISDPFGGVFEMNPQKITLSDTEYSVVIEKIKAGL